MSSLASNRERNARSVGLGEVLRVRVELWLAVVFMALAFGAGMAVRVVSGPEGGPAAVTSLDTGGAFPVAPPLTDQQIDQGLPAGHPDIGGGDATTNQGGGGGGSKASDQGSKGSKGTSGTKADEDASGGGAGTP